jgi:hypothetical protein
MRHLLSIVILLSIGQAVCGQSLNKKNEIFLELGGNGLLGSVNYSRQLTKNPMFEVRVGLGAYGSDPKTYLTIPLAINYIIDIKSQHAFLNLGFGATYTKADVRIGRIIDYEEGLEDTRSERFNIIPNLGYRYYTTKDFSYRINWTPVFNRHGVYPILFGISVGKRF